MKIISNYKDYYDNLLKYGIDETIIYKRNIVEYLIDVKNSNNKKNNLLVINDFSKTYFETFDNISWFFNHNLDVFYIGFCGKIYLGFKSKADLNYTNSFFSKKDLIEYINNYPDIYKRKSIIDDFYNNNNNKLYYYNTNITIKNIDEYFNKYSMFYNDNIFIKLNCPVFVIVREHYLYNKLSTNIILKQYNFMKLFNTYDAYQEIERYLNKLQQNEKEIVTISDKIKIHKHGFDKYTFKKEKKERKKIIYV